MKLSIKERREQRNAIQKRTYLDAVRLLDETGKCAMLRPTGFGKTYLCTRLACKEKYERILYLYPTSVISAEVERNINTFNANHVDRPVLCLDYKDYRTADFERENNKRLVLMTYSMLGQLSTADFDIFADFDLVITDELHRIGAEHWGAQLENLISHATPNCRLLGASATPERLDLEDVVGKFFDNNMTFEYTLKNATDDGILLAPIYKRTIYKLSQSDFLKLVDSKMDVKLGTKVLGRDKDVLINSIKESTLFANELLGVEDLLKEAIDDGIRDYEMPLEKGYQKWLIFSKDIKKTGEDVTEVAGWFKKLYPKHTIRVTVTTSKNSNIGAVLATTGKNYEIDLIFNVDQLREGYHIEDLTGLIMYRRTHSNIVFGQQLGRCFGVNHKYPCIVIDILNNVEVASNFSTGTPMYGTGVGLGGEKHINPPMVFDGVITVKSRRTELDVLVAKIVAEEYVIRLRRAYENFARMTGSNIEGASPNVDIVSKGFLVKVVDVGMEISKARDISVIKVMHMLGYSDYTGK